MIVYGDYECPFCAALEPRLGELAAARGLPALPGALEPPARARRGLCRRGRGAAGRVLADARRAVRRPGAAGGPAPVGARRARSGSTSRASTPTAAPTRCAARVARALPRRRPRRAWRRRRRCSPTACATPGRPGPELWARLREPCRRSNRASGSRRIPRAHGRHATPSSSSALRADETGEAMRALYRAYAGELYGFALNALGDRGAAEEIVQEVFTRAWRHAGTYDPGARQRAHLALPDRPPRDHRRAPARRRCARRWRCTSPGEHGRRGACRRSSRRCSAGRSPPRSSG